MNILQRVCVVSESLTRTFLMAALFVVVDGSAVVLGVEQKNSHFNFRLGMLAEKWLLACLRGWRLAFFGHVFEKSSVELIVKIALAR